MAQPVVEVGLEAEGLTIQQAAGVAGVSERTVRRWIKEGRLAAEKVPTAQGYEWRVQVPGGWCPSSRPARRVAGETNVRVPGTMPIAAPPVAGPVESSAGEGLVRALALVERLQRENLELAGRVGFLQGQLQETQAQLLALAPPAAAPVAPAPLAVAEPLASGRPSPGRWRRLWRVLGGAAGV